MGIDEKYIRFKAARSSGPGGQRVNKRATKVQAQVKIEALPFSEEEKKRIREKLSNRIDGDDELMVESEEERFQERNRERVIEKLNELIEDVLHKDPPRIPTEPHPGVDEERLQHKHARYQKKKSRRESKTIGVEEHHETG